MARPAGAPASSTAGARSSDNPTKRPGHIKTDVKLQRETIFSAFDENRVIFKIVFM